MAVPAPLRTSASAGMRGVTRFDFCVAAQETWAGADALLCTAP